MRHNYREIVDELGRVERMGSSLPDPYLDVPEVYPVNVITVRFTVPASSSVIDTPTGTTETKIPFNLDILRKHLAHVSLARRVHDKRPRRRADVKDAPFHVRLLIVLGLRPEFRASERRTRSLIDFVSLCLIPLLVLYPLRFSVRDPCRVPC